MKKKCLIALLLAMVLLEHAMPGICCRAAGQNDR